MRDVPAPLVPPRAAAAAVASNAATIEGAPRSPPNPQPVAEALVNCGQNLSALGGVSRAGTCVAMGSPSAPTTPAPTRTMLSAQSSKRSIVNTDAARGFLSSKQRRKTGELARAAALAGAGAGAGASGMRRIPLAAPSAARSASADANVSPPPQQQQQMSQQQPLASPVSLDSNTTHQQHRHGAHGSASLLTARGSRVAAKIGMEARPTAATTTALGGGGESNSDNASPRCHPNIAPMSTSRLPIAGVQQVCPAGLPSALGPRDSAKQQAQDSRLPQSQPMPTPTCANSRFGSNNTAAVMTITSGEGSLPTATPYTCSSGRVIVSQPRSEHRGKDVSSSARARACNAAAIRGSGGGSGSVGNIPCDNQVPTSAQLSSSPTFPTPLPPSSPRVAALGETHSSANSSTGTSTSTGVSSASVAARRRRRGQPQQQLQVQVPSPAPPLPPLTPEAFATLSQALAQSPSPPSWSSGNKVDEPWVDDDEAKQATGVPSEALVVGASSRAVGGGRGLVPRGGKRNGEGAVADVGGAGVADTEDTDLWAMSPSEGLEVGEPGERGVEGVGGGIAVRALDDGVRAEVVEPARKTGEANVVLVMEEKEVRDY